MKRLTLLPRVAVLAVLTGLASCGGGGPGLPPLSVVLFNFAPGFAGVPLNAPLELTMSAPVDAASVTADSVRIFTTTTTTAEPDPGAPAIGKYQVSGNRIVFQPRLPQNADLSDAGLRIGFTYAVQVPASPDVIEPVRTVERDPNVVSYSEFFTTVNHTILPAPGDITAVPNLNSLNRFFIDLFDETNSFGADPCPRDLLPAQDRDSPQVIDTDPDEGEGGFGTITGIVEGLGTAFVRLDPITVEFSEPIGPWRIRPENIVIRNTNLGGEAFDLFFFFTQNCEHSRLQITVFDADSAFDQASVPQGRYVLSLSEFTDLAGNPLVNSGTCIADGTFQLSFSTVSSPSLPTDINLSFGDENQDGVVDYGGLSTGANNSAILPEHDQPFLGGFAVDHVANPSPSTSPKSSANWGNTAFWTGCEVRYDNGFDPDNPGDQIGSGLRLRGGTNTGATPIMAPIAGRGDGRSDPAGSLDGTVASAEPGKVDFILQGAGVASFNTGDATTGPIVYHFNRFDLLTDTTTGERPILTYLKVGAGESIWPMLIFVEDEAVITGTIDVSGRPGELGFNGLNGGPPGVRNPGGLGGLSGPGGGDGGAGGSATLGADPELINGQTGSVPFNVLGPLDGLSEAMATIANMVTGGGGHYDPTQPEENDPTVGLFFPAYQGGGGGGQGSEGTEGSDFNNPPSGGGSDQGASGSRIGSDAGFAEDGILATGGAGGGGGAADDDAPQINDPDAIANAEDDGGGGGGGGAGFFGMTCGGDIIFGILDFGADPEDPADDTIVFAEIRAVGGRGGSTYDMVFGTPPQPGAGPDPDITQGVGSGEAGGGGGGGGICFISGGEVTVNSLSMFAFGKRGGNSEDLEGRGPGFQGGNGGGGEIVMLDSTGIAAAIELSGPSVEIVPNVFRDLDDDGINDLTAAEIMDRSEMSGTITVSTGIYGDADREPLFGTTRIVTEFFDTMSDSVSYDAIRVLSNAPRFPYSVADPAMRTMRVFLDVTQVGAGGLPDLSTEDPATGSLIGPEGATFEAGLHFDQDTGLTTGVAEFDSRSLIPANSALLGKRFARVRILFDLTLVGDPAALLGSFAPGGTGDVPIADDPGTAEIENSQGNVDAAPDGVPAIAAVLVRFTP